MAEPNPQDAAEPLSAGSTLGVFGGGQLGRMFADAAKRLGFATRVFAPEGDCPASQVADAHTAADYHDFAEVEAFAKQVAAATLEFENVPVAAVEAAGRHTRVRPGGEALFTVQDRAREKRFLTGAGVPVAPFAVVRTEEELRAAVDQIGAPSVLKTTKFGYDGKGQQLIRGQADNGGQTAGGESEDGNGDVLAEAAGAWAYLGRTKCVLEGFVDFRREVSVIVARCADGETAVCGPIENDHANHILDVSVLPAACSEEVANEAKQIALTVARELEVVGVLCVEFFETTDGRVLVNEIAPRTHNSGHLTIEACHASQFEQQARAVAGLPLGSFEAKQTGAMANLLGDLWFVETESGDTIEREPEWERLDDFPEVRLHLYGKRTARRGRKMGHLTAVAATPEAARSAVVAAREALAVL